MIVEFASRVHGDCKNVVEFGIAFCCRLTLHWVFWIAVWVLHWNQALNHTNLVALSTLHQIMWKVCYYIRAVDTVSIFEGSHLKTLN